VFSLMGGGQGESDSPLRASDPSSPSIKFCPKADFFLEFFGKSRCVKFNRQFMWFFMVDIESMKGLKR
jgi:hypothetical protein